VENNPAVTWNKVFPNCILICDLATIRAAQEEEHSAAVGHPKTYSELNRVDVSVQEISRCEVCSNTVLERPCWDLGRAPDV